MVAAVSTKETTMTAHVRNILRAHNCVLEGEFFFALKSGKIATRYVNIDPLLTKPAALDTIARSMALAQLNSSAMYPTHVVAGPAVDAVPLIYAVSREHCDLGNMAFDDTGRLDTVFAEKHGDDFILDRLGFEKAVRGRKIWIVEDVTTTGQSAKKTGAAIEKAGGLIVAYSFIWNRDPIKVNSQTMSAPVQSLITESIESYAPGNHSRWGVWPMVSDICHPDKFPDYPGPRITLLT